MWIVISVAIGFVLDLCLGDPVWMPHPVVWIGKGITRSERILRKCFPKTSQMERVAGVILAIVIPICSACLSLLLLFLLRKVSFWLWFVLHTFWSYQILATRCLTVESKKVCTILQTGDLPKARQQLSHLVGRETKELSEEEVAKACVETVAENTSDGVVAPLLYLMLGGVPLGFWYKAVNTLDSMVGYRNEKYQYFGTASARLDDIANFLPARLCALLMILSAWVVRLDGKAAWKIFRRDRLCHLSPNSAQTESVAAGALGLALGGSHVYFGKVVEKPVIGDDTRPAEPDDILRANRLLYCTSILTLLLLGMCRIMLALWVGY